MKQPRSFWFSLKRILGLASAGVAMSFFIWFLLGLFSLVPSLTQVFGFEQLRIPAGIVVGSLLFTAICFKDL